MIFMTKLDNNWRRVFNKTYINAEYQIVSMAILQTFRCDYYLTLIPIPLSL